MSPRSDPPEPGDPGLRPAHARAIRATFEHVSDLLVRAKRIGRGDLGPFDRYRPDVSPEEARRLAETVDSIHEQMLRAVARLGLVGPGPASSARWTIRTSLLFADIALSELSPEALRAYGMLGEAEGAEIDRIARDLRHLVSEAMRVVEDGEVASPASSADSGRHP